MATLLLDAPATARTVERRRPGRRAQVAPALLPLLRAEERAKLAPLVEIAAKPSDGEGVVLGVVLGTVGWAIIGSGIWALTGG